MSNAPATGEFMSKTPAIGITSQVVRQAKWYKYIGKLGFGAVEINRRDSKLHFNMFFLEKIKKYMSGFDLSVHSGTAGIFQACDSFTSANLGILTAEIDVCHYLGAKDLVFHMTDGFLSPGEKKRFREVITHAGKLGISMLYESNSTLKAEYAYDMLDSFPELDYVLDLGHLNNGFGRGELGCGIEEFIDRVKTRVVYVHASNNSGGRDDHLGLNRGTLNWRGILDMLDLSIMRKIIIEVRDMGMVEESRRLLFDYFAAEEPAELPKYAVG